MAISLDKNCIDQLHDWQPIIDGTQTVGLVCMICGKRVREDMERSEIIVQEDGTINGLSAIHAYRRKDARF